MATSSFFHNVEIKTREQAEMFCKGLEEISQRCEECKINDVKGSKSMRYIIDGQGHKFPIDDSNADTTNCKMVETATIVDDNVFLIEKYLVTAYRNNNAGDSREDELNYETSVEKIFDIEPTEDELIHFLVSNGFGLYDYITVNKIRQLDYLC